jgi:hypothetical protein
MKKGPSSTEYNYNSTNLSIIPPEDDPVIRVKICDRGK